MGSQQRNVNLSIKSGGQYIGNYNQVRKTEFNPYQKYIDNTIKHKKKGNKQK